MSDNTDSTVPPSAQYIPVQPQRGIPGNANQAQGRAMTQIPQDAAGMYRIAAAAGAAPDPSEIMQEGNAAAQLRDQQDAQLAAQLRAKTAGQFTGEDYTLSNHGLQALPHIQRY